MESSAQKGNDPKRWLELLTAIDNKMQLSLLAHLKRVTSYHFEDKVLFIEPQSGDDEKYLSHPETFQQLEILAKHVLGIERVQLRKYPKTC